MSIESRRPAGAGPVLEDYQNTYAVLERSGSANDLTTFKELLIEALQEVFDVSYATFFEGHALQDAFDDRGATVTGDSRGQRALAEYHDRWSRSDVYATPQAVARLEQVGVATMRSLGPLPYPAQAYVLNFLTPLSIERSAALLLPLCDGSVGLVGLFGQRPGAVPIDTRPSALLLLTRHLRTITRLLPRGGGETLEGLTSRQQDVARMAAQGATNASIARQLGLAEDTVKKYVSAALSVTGCRSRTELSVRLR